METTIRDTSVERAGLPSGVLPAWAPIALVGLFVAKAALDPRSTVLAFAFAALGAVTLVARAGSSRSRLVLACAVALELLFLPPRMPQARPTVPDASARFAAVDARAKQILAGLGRCAATVASLPEARRALAGSDRSALDALFASLQQDRGCDRSRPALAVRGPGAVPVAWSGRVGDLAPLRVGAGPGTTVVVSNGSLSTRWVAVAPIEDRSGAPLGFATAETTVAVRRHIENEFLSDFDLLAEAAPGVEVRYLDTAGEPLTPRLGPGDRIVSSSDGRPLAVVGPTAVPAGARPDPVLAAYRGAAGLLGGSFLVLVAAGLVTTQGAWLPGFLALMAARCALLLLPAKAGWSGGVLDPEPYASAALGPLTRTPLDLFLTALLAAALGCELLRWTSRRVWAFRWPRALALDLLALALLGAVFAVLGGVVARTPLDVQAIAVWPDSPAHLVLQGALLLILAAGAAALVALFGLGGPLPRPARLRIPRLAIWIGVGLLANAFWPRQWVGVPLVPAVALYLAAALLGGTTGTWRPKLEQASPGERAGYALAATSALTLLLYPTVVHFAEKETRSRIEGDYAPAVLRQPARRQQVLASTREQIDAMGVLEVPSGRGYTPLVDELAFFVWSRTDLAAFGFSSAVEIQDSTGALISRFALNLPSLSATKRSLPASDSWVVSEDVFPLGSVERRVLHARRLLVYHGQVHGAVHVLVGTDFWNLPFLRGRDPYSVLYRTGPRGMERDGQVELFAMTPDRALLFNSAERPPVVDSDVVARTRQGAVWTTLSQEDGAEHTYVFRGGQTLYGLGFPRKDARRFAAELVEAVTGMTLSAAAVLLLVLTVRTAFGCSSLSLTSMLAGVRERFSLRLFVTFIAVAVLPVVVLEGVVRNFVSDRLRREAENEALERAATARKIVEDYALFQRSESPGQQLVTDSALVWVSSAIRNDLDVFLGGRLQASSKRELYASGLLAPRVPGRTYRGLVIEGRPSVVGMERIGRFSYRVAAVPVRLEAGETGILSMPLALRQRETQNALADLDRAIRLSSILFLVAAAGIAHSMARRISGPVRGLTQAAQRIARGDLEARVATRSRDEFLALVEAFNQMAGDLERQRIDLERSNRRAAWADMARQVAHEVKNPLTPIQLSAEHLRRLRHDRSADFDSALESCTETILGQVRKLREIVTEFSAFARPPESRAEDVDVAILVAEALDPYTQALPPGVELIVDARGPVPLVAGDRRLLERAVLNLVENALQAVGDAGTVAVRVRADPGPAPRVIVEVEDSAGGLDPEAAERAFEPFFSTKMGGSGLGLALVRKIAEDQGGGASLEGDRRFTRARMWLRARGGSGGDAVPQRR